MPRCLLVLAFSLSAAAALPQPRGPAVPSPRAVLGYEIGEYHTSYLGVVRYVETLAAAAPDRVRLVPIGESYERRPMMLLVISSPENIARLDEIKADIAGLTDPRTISDAQADEIIARTPAIAWSNFGNDGNESAAVEAALELAHLLAAPRDDEVARALDDVVVVLNVCHNPESRERFVNWYNSMQVGPSGTADPQALEHRGPWAQDTNNNHYQIDLNRDSVWATQRETRNVIAAYREWNPQTFIDHHGETENFFFPPVALPINQNLPQFHLDWLETYGRAIADAIDARGWSYFTGEIFDEFYPGYWDAYPFLKGGIGFTFETNAGGYTGLRVERDDKTVITLRDGIDKHVVGALAVIRTTAAQRERKLRDYYRFRKTAIEEGRAGPTRAYVVVPGADPGRAAALVETLTIHGVEVRRTTAETSLPGFGYLASGEADQLIPAGSYVIPLEQPEKRMIQALMEREPRLQEEFIAEQAERRAFNRSRGRNERPRRLYFYDVTAWALPHAFNVEAYGIGEPVAATEPLERPVAPVGVVGGGPARMAYLFDPRPLAATRLALDLLREDFNVAVSREPLHTDGRDWPRGTFVVRIERNPESLHDRVATLARRAGVDVAAVHSAWTDEGVDLGSPAIDSLKPPRIAVLADQPTSATAYGAIWFLLEQRLGQPFTALRPRDIGSYDLDRYDVIVLPDGDAGAYQLLIGGAIDRLGRWVERGGVLVCTGRAAQLAIDKGWTGATRLGPETAGGDDEDGAWDPESDVLETEWDRHREAERRSHETEYTPGAVFAAELDSRHVLSFGYDEGPLPVLVRSDRVFSASPTGSNVARIRRDDPRLAGFAWPEAEQRLRGAAYLIDEPRGAGRVIVFVENPLFRNFWRGLEKLFTNALLLGPSLR